MTWSWSGGAGGHNLKRTLRLGRTSHTCPHNLQGTNNYEADVYNGDLGTVKSVNEKERFVEVRAGRWHAYIRARN